MKIKMKMILGLLTAFSFVLRVSCDEQIARRDCYFCDSIENCKQDVETMEIETCNITPNLDQSENYCIEHEAPTNGSVISRGCAAKVVEVNGEHQTGYFTIYFRFEEEYTVNRFCLCEQDLCNFNRCKPKKSNPQPQGKVQSGTTIEKKTFSRLTRVYNNGESPKNVKLDGFFYISIALLNVVYLFYF